MTRKWRVGALSVILTLAASAAAAPWAKAAIMPGVFPGGVPAPCVVGNYGSVDRINPWQGTRNAVINFFDCDSDLGVTLAQMLLIWDTYKAVPMLSYGSVTGNNSRAALDAEHLKLGAMLNRFVAGPDGTINTGDDRRVYLRYLWEPNVSSHPWSPGANCGAFQGTAADYVNAWRRAHGVINQMVGGHENVAWVFNVNSVASTNCYPVANLYPGNAYVDWVGIDAYAVGCPPPSPAAVIGPMLSALRSLTGGTKPVSMSEVGATHLGSGHSVAAKDQWIRDYWTYIRGQADIKMSVWFNADAYPANDTDCNTFAGEDWGVFGGQTGTETFFHSQSGQSYKAYRGYREGLQGSSLATTNPSNPRYMTNAQFWGQ